MSFTEVQINTSPPKSRNRKRLSLTLQFASMANAESIESPRGTQSPTVSTEGQSATPISPTQKKRRPFSINMPGCPTSLLRPKPHLPVPDEDSEETSTRQTVHSGWTLSEALTRMGITESAATDLDERLDNIPSALIAVKESSAAVPSVVTRKISRNASASVSTPMQKVKSFMLPRPSFQVPTKHPKGVGLGRMLSSHTALDMGGIESCAPLERVTKSPAPGEDRSFTTASFTTADEEAHPHESIVFEASTPKIHRRRMSLDLAMLKQREPSSTSTNKSALIRSHSVWNFPTEHSGHNSAPSFEKTNLWSENVNERQRVLNVRRARKMTKLFGSEPPSVLYQVTNLNDEEQLDGSSIAGGRNRDSIITIVSVGTAFSPSVHRRSISMTSIAHPDDTAKPSNYKDVTPSAPLHFERSVTEGSTPAFKARRRQAAKLTSFFGVDYHDLSTSVTLPLSPNAKQEFDIRDSSYTSKIASAREDVDVRITGPTRFWGFADRRRNMQEANMEDVIGKLRNLKAK